MKYGNATEPNKIRAGLPRTETCTIEGCEQPGHAAQLCKRHYRNLNLYGEPQTYKREPTGTPRPSGQNLAEAFAYHQEGKPPRPNECWEWRGYRTPDGYGRFVFEMKNIPAHRAAYQVYNGPIPNGMVIRHTCDTPPCVNPAHLLVGKPADNVRDRTERDRTCKGSDKPQSKLCEADVRDIRRRYAAGESQYKLKDEYGVAQNTIWSIVHRITWSHVD